MKRVILFILAVAAFSSLVSPTAGAEVPCRDRIYNDWYHDGKIATSYPVACYRDALKHVKGDALVYSSLADDIRAAMQGALALKKGDTKVPAQIGTHNTAVTSRPLSSSKPKQTNSPHDPSSSEEQVDSTLPTSTVAAGATSGGGTGVPMPLLVLGCLALLLTAVGAAGLVAKRRRT